MQYKAFMIKYAEIGTKGKNSLTETETETRVADASAMAIETRAEEALTEMVATVSATVSICHLARMTRMTAQLRREHHSRETARTSMRRRCRVRI